MKRYTVIFILFIILLVVALVKYKSGASWSSPLIPVPTTTVVSPTPTRTPQSRPFQFAGSPHPHRFAAGVLAAFAWWWNSPIHHDNMMSSKISEIGIGYAYTTTSDYGGYYTIDFGRPTLGN